MKLRRLMDTGEWTTRRYLSLLGTVLIWLIVAIDAWYLWPSQLGGHTSMVIVSGESMEPTYFDGDLVIARKMDPSIGDVIIYAPAGLGGSQIVHRIIGGNAEDGWELQGDNNDFVDPFTPSGDEIKGVVLVHYSNFGRVTALLLNPLVWAFVLLAAIVLLLWWSDDCDDDDEDDEDEDDAAAGESAEDAASEDVPLDPGRDPVPEGAQAQPVPVARMSLGKRTVRRTSTVVLSALVAAGVMAAPASASGLDITVPGAPSVHAVAKCGTQALDAAVAGPATGGSYTGVSVSGIAPACQGLPATVYVHNTAGAVIASGSVSSTTATTAFTTSSYAASNVSAVVLKVKGWVFMADWTPPAPAQAVTCIALSGYQGTPTGQSCDVTFSTRTVSFNPWPVVSAYSFSFTVSTPAPSWAIVIDTSHAQLPPIGVTSIGTNGNPATGYCVGSVFTGYKNPSWNSNDGYMQMHNDGGNYGTRLCP